MIKDINLSPKHLSQWKMKSASSKEGSTGQRRKRVGGVDVWEGRGVSTSKEHDWHIPVAVAVLVSFILALL